MWVLASCGPRPGTLAEYREVGDFTLIERSARPFERSRLQGKIWVANFFFAGCSAECNALNQRMSEIQEHLRTLTNTCLVSFTVDPTSDTPEALTRYAAGFGADPDRWFFLTGDRQVIYRTITESFLLPVAESPIERARLRSGFVHSDKVAVVDTRGVVRAYFDGLDPRTPERVHAVVQQLQQAPVPASNP
jgi:cytochrome oxidase Cu insertion factor (SCO1/SenC/PrrC family)